MVFSVVPATASHPVRPDVRPMRWCDLPAVMEIQLQAYGCDYQESEAVLASKLALAPQGCWIAEEAGEAVGYVFSHPWHVHSPPPLHVPLASVPTDSACVFLHDLAIVPKARSGGLATLLFNRVAERAGRRGYSRIVLVALESATGFWKRNGFVSCVSSESISRLLSGYGAGARFMQRTISAR